MSSTAATSLGVTTSRGSTGGCDAPGESGPGFLAALDAAQAPATAPAQPVSKQCTADAGSQTDEDQAGDESAAAAATAGMLQAMAVPADELAAEARSTVEEALADDGTAASRKAPVPTTWLVGARGANPGLDGEPGDVPVDAAAEAPEIFTLQGDPAKPGEANGLLPSQIGLRQMLQLMGQQPGASNQDAVAGADTTTVPGGNAAAAVKLVQGMADFAAANAAPAADQAPPLPTPASAPNSLLAAAATNFGSPLHAAPATGQPMQMLQTGVGTARWAEELGSRLTLMTLRGQHEGSLTLTPEHLGPLEVRISVSQNTANVWFGAQHADTRAALTEAMPRLRELFGDAGLSLGQTGVSQQAPRQGSREAGPARVHSAEPATGIEALDGVKQPAARRMLLGLVDTYV